MEVLLSHLSINLILWILKLNILDGKGIDDKYKFDPMDFETYLYCIIIFLNNRINLILWILKLDKFIIKFIAIAYKFDPMDFETMILWE